MTSSSSMAQWEHGQATFTLVSWLSSLENFTQKTHDDRSRLHGGMEIWGKISDWKWHLSFPTHRDQPPHIFRKHHLGMVSNRSNRSRTAATTTMTMTTVSTVTWLAQRLLRIVRGNNDVRLWPHWWRHLPFDCTYVSWIRWISFDRNSCGMWTCKEKLAHVLNGFEAILVQLKENIWCGNTEQLRCPICSLQNRHVGCAWGWKWHLEEFKTADTSYPKESVSYDLTWIESEKWIPCHRMHVPAGSPSCNHCVFKSCSLIIFNPVISVL